MKAELKDTVHVATIDTCDWESIKPCKKCETRLRGKKLRYHFISLTGKMIQGRRHKEYENGGGQEIKKNFHIYQKWYT